MAFQILEVSKEVIKYYTMFKERSMKFAKNDKVGCLAK